MSDDAPEDPNTPSPPRGRQLPFTWLGLLLAGWVLYEVTAQPALGTALVCLKFGWEDFRTARWLRRTDPDRTRGHACFWLYTAAGIWKAAGVALLTNVVVFSILAVAAENNAWKPGAPGMKRLFGAMFGAGLTTLVGLALASVAVVVALVIAWRNGFRLWLGRCAGHSRRWATWPPQDGGVPHANRLVSLVVTAVPVPMLALLSIVAVRIQHLPMIVPADALLPAVFWLQVLLTVGLGRLVSRRVAARFPAECWPPTPVDPAPADPVGW